MSPLNATAADGPVLTSLLEMDLYKFTMWQALWRRHPHNTAEYHLVCRQRPERPLAELLPQVQAELDALCALRFSPQELAWLGGLRFMRADFVAWLADFRLQRGHIRAWAEGETLRVVAQGPQVQVMGFEILVLALVNGLYFRRLDTPAVRAEGERRLQAKIDRLQAWAAAAGPQAPAFELFDFGLRRRFSADWQAQVLQRLQQGAPGSFCGTSNAHLARTLGLTPIGTMAHEYLQTYQALDGAGGLGGHQRRALQDWLDTYGGDLGIALTDVVGMDAFLADFDADLARRYAGLRHDSGDPLVWAHKALAHYERLGIEARDKRLVFSDGLTLEQALGLHQRLAGRARLGFGIGTHLTNDLGLAPLNVVMKLMRCNGQPVAKLSDSPGKTLCEDAGFLARLRQAFPLAPRPAAA
ncbi:nicotinate phosphoribosyltransferase [Ideonella livida]|uniref:Nicotinate phosphoribosyltransferase n=1 Tax=Ideonella livida TaxID=2707176 RepID=A0A7C9TLE5_9BURK|nr:nicotinate phosphoribosyltransferase [Ideonella livida]NDY93479.1 nicotinate phosphoribosyltransferase [Ideonella livida]